MDVRNQVRSWKKLASGGLRRPTLVFSVAILALAALSTHGTLDDFAGERLRETTIESFAIYGVARALNATISVIQSIRTGGSAGVVVAQGSVGVDIGEALDPLNDAIERFSTVMTWALGSLLLQGVVLAFVSSSVFKWLFALIALVAFATLMIVWRRLSAGTPGIDPLNRSCGAAVKIFVVAAIVRFIVPIFVIVSYLAGQALLQPEIDRRSEELSAISEEVSGDDEQILDQLAIEESEVAELDAQDPATDDGTSMLDLARAAAAGILPDLSMPDFTSMIPNFVDRAVNLVEYSTRLLVLIAVKNIILPLVFLAIALKVLKPATMGLLAMGARIERDLKAIKGETKKIGTR